MSGILAMILAGGEGARLFPLTEFRSKSAVPFGGTYKLIDFALNNFVNSDIMNIYVLTQFKSQSLNIHLQKAWYLSGFSNRFIDPLPAQQRLGNRWYDGTADAIHQNAQFIEEQNPDQVCIFSSEHVYKMDVRQMLDWHKEKQAVLTVSAVKMPKEIAYQFGVIEVDEDGKMIGFVEKPLVEEAKTIPGDPEYVLASMGNYIFETKTLLKALSGDSKIDSSTHDFGKDVIPYLYKKGNVYVYDYATNVVPGESKQTYWQDIGTIDSYWKAHMDLLSPEQPFSLYNEKWPLHTSHPPLPPATFRDLDTSECDISQSLVGAGSYITAAKLFRSLLGFKCNIQKNTILNECVLLGNVKIGKNCRLNKVIIDKNVHIADGTIIGENLDEDRQKFTVSDQGIVVIAKNSRIGF